ncbi:hypothetical protein JTE90_022609 [Oedothorax gibbosus]|uniref:Uncharacterized protein n=1 Tax=Oedothorax gibbosus TaxID=931172 RepID=A0AAV6TUQ0_9ARAC|nr:hypothetical protein JTE90_022609 [Oedothorax gibbosus]
MTGHALDKQRAYFRYRNQLRTQIRRRDYCQMHLNRSTILANTKDNKLEPDIFEKYSDLTNEVKEHLLKSVYKDITEVSHLPDETMKAQAQDDVITSYEDRLRKLGEEFQTAAAQEHGTIMILFFIPVDLDNPKNQIFVTQLLHRVCRYVYKAYPSDNL